MATEIKTVCDRCGVEIPDRRKYPIAKLKCTKLFPGNPCEYYDRTLELCDDCGLSFYKWLNGEVR